MPEGKTCFFGEKAFRAFHIAHKERWAKLATLPVSKFWVPPETKPPRERMMHKNLKQTIRAQCAKGRHWMCTSIHCSCACHAIEPPVIASQGERKRT
jgi:hypothetical protein